MRTTPARAGMPVIVWLGAVAAASCADSPSELALRAITSGTVGGVSFTVTGGTIYQAAPGDPIYADSTGGRLVLDENPSGLGMGDPDRLRLQSQFALADGGSIQIAGFGEPGDELGSGLRVLIERNEGSIDYGFWLGGTLFADGSFTPEPSVPSAEQWVVSEFYAQDVPGYGPGQSGITIWGLNELATAPGTDVLGCDPGPAIQPVTLDGDAIGYALEAGWIVAIEVIDEIVGPCV